MAFVKRGVMAVMRCWSGVKYYYDAVIAHPFRWFEAGGGFMNGGVQTALGEMYRMDVYPKVGELVGEDKYGNKYFQNDFYYFGMNRWVKYSDQYGMNFDASQIPAEWHRWLQYMTDDPPTIVKPDEHRWLADHEENLTGSSVQYVPYSTVKQKIQAWDQTGKPRLPPPK